MTITCSNCGKELPDDTKFCSECGTTVVVQEKRPDYCANCFAELPEGVKFCLQCGKPAAFAQPNYPSPERDKAIYDELYATSPQYVRYLEHKAIAEDTGTYPPTGEAIEDFEQNKAKLAQRARKWAEYDTSNNVERIHWFQELHNFRHITWRIKPDFDMEQMWFPTNKPNHHKALFYEEFINYQLLELRQQGVLTWYDPPQLTKLFYDYMRKVEGWTDEDLEEFKLKPPDMEEIRGWAAKDDELFPPPQPLRVEVAGAILNFTTDEAAVIVYVDCSQSGNQIKISCSDRDIDFELSMTNRNRAEVIDRSSNNKRVCAAIFSRIPFVTNRLRNKEKALTQVECTVELGSLKQSILLTKGKLIELDWQAETKPKTPATTATSTIGTPSNAAMMQGVTITLKQVEHNDDECVYLLKIDDPNYIEGGYEQEWVVPLEGAEMPGTMSSYGASSASLGRMTTSSSSEAYEATSRSPQKPRKPLGGHFRKPQ